MHPFQFVQIVDCILLGLEKGVMEELAAPLGNLSNQRNAVSILPFDMASPAIMSIRDDLNKPEVVTTLEEVKNWLTTVRFHTIHFVLNILTF